MNEQKNILITGTSSGFGTRMVETMAEAGHHVFATMRESSGRNAAVADHFKQLAESRQQRITVLEMDVSNEESVNTAIENAISTCGKIDVVVNNAGIAGFGLTEGFTVDQSKQVFDVNVFGVLRVTRAVLPHMRANKDGLIIYISSISGRLHLPMMGVYNPSKYAVESIAENFHFETSALGIDNVIIEPGAYGTEIFGKLMQPAEPERTNNYGGLETMPEQMGAQMGELLQAEDAPNPQWVADAVKTIIDTPKGARPLRTVVGTLATAGVAEFNEAGDNFQHELYQSLGLA